MIETPTYITHRVLSKETEVIGDLPILITVPHDGRDIAVMGQGIMPIPGGTPGDRNVRYIANDLCDFVENRMDRRPSLVIDDIKRSRRWATSPVFDRLVKYRMALLTGEFEGRIDKPPLFLDLHGFVKQPPFGDYDLILGTSHRTSLQSDIDLQFGEYMERLGYAVYVPQEHPVEGELFGADSDRTLTRQVSNEFPHVDCVQVEIHQDFRTAEGRERGVQLASDIADFVVEYAAGYYYTQD